MSPSRRILRRASSPRRSPRLAVRVPGRTASALSLALLLLAWAPPAAAITVTVPDDFATIQQAIDSGVDEILIRPGTYAETPVVTRPLSLRGLIQAGAPADALPVLGGLVFDDLAYEYVHNQYTNITDLRFSGAVQNAYNWNPYWNPYLIAFSRCILDAGMNDAAASVGGQLEYEFHGCTFNGPINLGYPDRIWIDGSVVRHAITLTALSYRLSWFTLTSSRVSGSGAIGLDISLRAENIVIRGNTFEGYEVPIQYFGNATLELYHNTFTGPGRYAIHAQYDVLLDRNTIVGYEVGLLEHGGDGNLYLIDNRIEHCTRSGVEVDGYYIDCERDTVISCGTGMALSASYGLTVRDNIVQSCSSDGMSIRGGDEPLIASNVVSHCGGNGIAATLASPYGRPVVFVKNTSCLNGTSGYSLVVTSASGTNKLDHNIAFGNGVYGLRVTTTDSLTLACNDWFANASGATDGIAPSASDLAVDPRFCDLASDDAWLAADSPLLDAPGCGRIGALGQGCEAAPMAMEFDFTPGTLSLASRGHWVTGFLEPPAPFAASDIDIASIRLNGTVPVDPPAPTALGDHDGNGVPDLMVKFNRVAVELTLSEGGSVPVVVTGTVDGRAFLGTDAIRVRRAVVSAPAAGSHLTAGAVAHVRWQAPSGSTSGPVALLHSLDGGNTWSVIASGQPNTGSYDWSVPGLQTDRARVALVLSGADEETGVVVESVLGVSEAFTIEAVLGAGDRGTAPIALAIRGVTPNPAAGGRLWVEFALRDGSEARLDVLDVAGRVLTSRQVGTLGPGLHGLNVAEGSALQPGIYFLRLTQAGSQVRARAAVVR